MINRDILYKEIVAAFTDRAFMAAEGFTKDEILGSTDRLEKAVSELMVLHDAEGRYHSKDILYVWRKYFARTKDIPEDGWLLHTYTYIRNQMFPHIAGPADAEIFALDRACLLQFMRGVYEYERKALKFNPRRDFNLLTDAEITSEGFIPEYIRMHKAARSKYIYEFMRIGIDTTPFDTLGHVAGVHYVAMYAARQLYKVHIPVDLGLISAAAASHDIGKYGCRKQEERRIPYLHYYYTDYCLNRFQLPTIAHIAANHSTWDLELENLSVESLLLIYADFRVKSTREKGVEIIHFYSLDEAFDVILSKLDNVDEAKKHRYTKVYNKLKDFENYMIEHGVETSIPDDLPVERADAPVPFDRQIVLMHGQDVIEQLKYKAVNHNIRLMSKFNSIEEFGTLLETARSEVNWKNLRTYITILDEYSTYMTDEQKHMTLAFLYEALSHRESDIREQAARLMGKVIGKYRREYKKELPEGIPASDQNVTNLTMFEEYIEKVIHPDHKYTEQNKKWIASNTDFVVNSVLINCRESCRHNYIEILEKYYKQDKYDEEMVIVLSSTAIQMPSDAITDSFREVFKDFGDRMYGQISVSDDLIILHAFEHLFGRSFDIEAKRRALIGLDSNTSIQDKLSSMFLNDLKANTPWTVKAANIHYMLNEVMAGDIDENKLLHVATHLSNLIKVSETVTVRKAAGDALLEVIKWMTADQINELLIELHNGLEIDDYQFSRFIPNYMGRVMLHLPPLELDEVIYELEKVINAGVDRTAASGLITVAICLEHYKEYTFEETAAAREARMIKMVGLLMKGFAYYNKLISHEAFTTLGEHIFDSNTLTLEEKHNITKHLLKRVLTVLDGGVEHDELDFYNNAAVLNQIYRYLSEYQSEVGEMKLCELDRVAFFPGTFDPFSLGHKAIATTIRDMGFEVYLAIDEFSWSKKTLPHMLRKNILGMSIADEEHLYIFPDNVSVNIANPSDLAELRRMFAGRNPYIAVGTDVVKNSSCYKKEPVENSIHSLNHIIFARETNNKSMKSVASKSYPITADIVNLTLSKYYEDISSTKIRQNVDLGRDISKLIDPIVQNYIYDNNFYSMEPAYKHVLQSRELSISNYKRDNVSRLLELDSELESRGYDLEQFHDYLNNTKVKTIFIETGTRERKISAFACARRMESHELLDEFGNVIIARKIRENAAGGIALISEIYSSKGKTISNLNQILVTELMTALLAKDYVYAVYHPLQNRKPNSAIIEVLKHQGFVNISQNHDDPVYVADLRSPIVIFRDVETVIKAPLNKNPRVIKALDDAHNKLLKTFTELYPGKLLITFNTSAVHSKIVDLVAKENGVPTTPTPDKLRGPYLSVPFGKALSDVVVPNTVTKALRTEKYFRNDLHGFTIRESKNQSTLKDQAGVLKSFDRPIILIDDLLHKGQRMNIIDPILREQNVDVHKIIVGLLTGNARDNMAIKNRAVEGAYFIPTIAMWLNERDCYPFIGGDSIDGISSDSSGSINFILPYTSFSFVGREDSSAIFKYSMTCLENTANILKVLEKEYQDTFGKKLTLRRLGDVITAPTRPLIGEGLTYDDHVAPSIYVENDIRKTMRLNNFKK